MKQPKAKDKANSKVTTKRKQEAVDEPLQHSLRTELLHDCHLRLGDLALAFAHAEEHAGKSAAENAEAIRKWEGRIDAIRQDNLPLVSLVYSGNKSIHGVIRADAPDAETWDRYRQAILGLFATDADARYRLDPQALHPLTGTRLAGVTRASPGKVQELLWIAPEWRDTEWQRMLNNPQCAPRGPSDGPSS